MKTKSKALLLALCAVLLVVGSVMGTMAYLTSTDDVVNTFTVGQVAITMDEADTDNSAQDKNRDQANAYHLLPGQTYVKDPTIHVDSNSEEAYIFVKLLVEDNADMKAALRKHGLSTDITTILTGYEADKWTATGKDNDDGSREYFLTYNTTVTGDKNDDKAQDIVIFSGIAMPGAFTNEDMKAVEDMKISVTAYAIQAAGFDTAADAWTAAADAFNA